MVAHTTYERSTYDIVVYLGRPGALEAIPLPGQSFEATRVRVTDAYQLASGAVRGQQTVDGSRVFAIAYDGLDYETYSILAAYHGGHNGPGPFAFLDPGRRNLLTANQSSAGVAFADTTDWTVAGTGGSIAFDSTVSERGPGSIRWTWASSTPASATLTLNPPSPNTWPGIPLPVRQHTFTVRALCGSGVSGSVTVALVATYLNTAGGTISSTTGSTVAVTGASWQTLTVSTGAPPAGFAYLTLSLSATVATIGAGEYINIDKPLLVEGSVADPIWTPGTGVRPVMVASLTDVRQMYAPLWPDGTLVLQELT